jgi:hypothetical protein
MALSVPAPVRWDLGYHRSRRRVGFRGLLCPGCPGFADRLGAGRGTELDAARLGSSEAAAMATYRIKQVGSLGTGWAIERDGVITGSHPSPMVLGAYLEAILAGAPSPD